MKKMFMAIVGLFLLTGCKDLEGVLNVAQQFSLKTTQGQVAVSPGQYQTSLDFKRNKVVAKMKTNQGQIKFEISTKETHLPENGQYMIPANKSGQNFDMYGENKTVYQRSEIKSGVESCTYQDHETVCTPKGCTTQPVTRWGQRYIQYYDETRTLDAQFIITAVQTTLSKAQFNGRSQETYRVVTSSGVCR